MYFALIDVSPNDDLGGRGGQKMTKDDLGGRGQAKDDEWLKYVYFALIDTSPNYD